MSRPILLVDDNHDDLFITKRLLVRAGAKNPIVTFDDAEAAMSFLRAAAAAPRTGLLPALVLCDIKMPATNGFDFLEWVRRQRGLKNLPVAMLSSSDLERDRLRADELGASGFFVKFPAVKVMADLLRQWTG